jgi:uncharacterized phage protein gp47/JayE
MTFPTRDDLFNVGANEVIERAAGRTTGRQITSDQIFTPGSDANLFLASSAAMGEEVSRAGARDVSDLTLEGAQRIALDRVASDWTSGLVVRKQAAPSRGELQFARSSIAAGAIQFDAGSVVQTPGGIRFELLQTLTLGASSLGPSTVEARAVEAGIGGNVSEGTITRFVTASPDSTLTVTNPEFFSGGDDVETDAALRSRVRQFFSAVRRGVQAAIEFGALLVEGVRQASAVESLDSAGFPDGTVYLYIADANGQANAQLIELVRISLLDFRAQGIVPAIIGAVPTLVEIILRLRYESNVDTLAAFEQVRDTIVANVNLLDPDETLDRSLIFEAARSVSGVIVRDDAIVTPTGDIVPSSGQVLRTSADIVTPEAS